MKPSGVISQRSGLTLVEVLVLLAIFLVLLAVLLPSHEVLEWKNGQAHLQQAQGARVYKAMQALPFDNPNGMFPCHTNGFASSTAYFRSLVARGSEGLDFSLFSGPGLFRLETRKPNEFVASGNAWSVCLDLAGESSATPFFFSRNLLAAHTRMVASNETLSVDMLADDPLDFDREAAVVFTKAGEGRIVWNREFGEGASAGRINPTGYRGEFLRP